MIGALLLFAGSLLLSLGSAVVTRSNFRAARLLWIGAGLMCAAGVLSLVAAL